MLSQMFQHHYFTSNTIVSRAMKMALLFLFNLTANSQKDTTIQGFRTANKCFINSNDSLPSFHHKKQSSLSTLIVF